ncbi:LysR family transcriptional regulator [Yinghuangia seranimata]|uniref:LysR family transcriptional regulator n=1 Tax=Yinghuangia seranimata TaxID=408067 RepID=UPI00248BF781|nr:LysR family transcriptional regulator [Yinghuangia seranimata]MDI2127837.1 LysR family transcriptional regulator [Yinghuangia seranimata]
MERDELDCFLILAEELHFGRTAERMRLSRSRVSQLVQRLERRVGAPLFARTSRRVALTAVGRGLRDDLAPLRRALDDAVDRARAVALGYDAVLHVGFSTPLAGDIVLKAADALRVSHPGLAVEICEVLFTDPYGQLRSGEFDVQLVELSAPEPGLGQGPVLARDARVLAVAAGHPLAGRAEVTMEDLADVPLLGIAADVPAHWRDAHAPDATPSGRPIGRGPAVTNMQEALMMVTAGRGALLTAAHTADYYTRPGVTYVSFADVEPIGYGLLWRAAEHTPAIGAFAQAAGAAARESATLIG